jgi:hypothetical protein
MEQAEQQHIRRTVSAEIVYHGINPLGSGIDPGFDLAEEVNPFGRGAAIVGMCQGGAAGRLESSEDIAAAPSAIVDLLFGPFGLGRGWFHGLLAWKASGRLWSHLVEADNYAVRQRRGVELLDGPLFW